MHPPEVAESVFFRECMDRTKALIKNYWNWRSRSYGYDADKSVRIANGWESIIKELVVRAPARRALDVGTGTGQLAVYLARAGFDVTGIDLSENMVSLAGQYAATQRLHIDFQTGDAEVLTFGFNSFDVVVSRNLLWTLPHPDKALEEWRRVLKPGGTLIVSDGLWLNITWKLIHHLAFKLVKGMCRNGSMISLRFFLSYASLQNSLPFYKGISFDKASMLLHDARFREIRSYDTYNIDFNPYENIRWNGKTPSFFIAYAKK